MEKKEIIELQANDKLIKFIDSLTVTEQICLFMFTYLDISKIGISAILKMDEEEVKNVLSTAQKKIRICVGKIDDEVVRKYCIAKLPFLMDIYAKELE